MEMSNKPDQATKVFSMQATDLYDFFEEAENQVVFGKELMSHYMVGGSDYLIGNLGEMCSISSKMSLILQDILEATDPEDEVVYIHAKDMMVLQTLLLNRRYLIEELESEGISFAGH
mgnify:CR=1 FL=1